MLHNLEFWNVVVIAVGVASVKATLWLRRREDDLPQVNEFRAGFITGLWYDAQITILVGVGTLALLLSEIIGLLGAFCFVALCLALLMAGPRLGNKVVMAFSTPKIQRRRMRRMRRQHART